MFHRPMRSILMLFAAFFLLFAVMPVIAQSSEPEVVPEQLVAVPDGSVILPAWQLFAFVFSGILGGGVVGVVGVGMVAKNIMNNPAALKNAEAVGNSVPQQTANKLIELADSAMSVAALAKEMLDRVPAETKASDYTTPSETNLPHQPTDTSGAVIDE